jgi:hypothetical protein
VHWSANDVALKPTENKNLVFFFSIKEHWEEIFEA